MIALVVSCPLGLTIWSALGNDILDAPMIASSAGLALAVGALLAWAPMRHSVVATALVFAGIGINAIELLSGDYRPDFRSAAELIETRTEPGDSVLAFEAPVSNGDGFLAKHLEAYLGDREVEDIGSLDEISSVLGRDGRGGLVAGPGDHGD